MTSSHKWQLLPTAFRAVDVMSLFSLSSNDVTKALYRWTRDGHISRLGKRLDVYINNAKCEHDSMRVPLMLNRLHPFATYCGPSVLQAYGWSTQLTPLTYCLLPRLTKDIYIEESEVVLLRRPHRWWKMMTPFISDAQGEINVFTQRHILPTALLAEALLCPKTDNEITALWSPPVDDLDFYSIDEQVTDDVWCNTFNKIATYYKKELPAKNNTKESWYEMVRHTSLSFDKTESPSV